MNAPAVSIVLATNRGADNPFLRATLRSVVDQTCDDVELVLVDDGSPRAVDLAGLPVPPRSSVVRTDAGGPSRARNLGAARASGTYLAFLDDDDLWEPERLATHVRAMRAAPALTLTYSRMRSIDAAGHEIAPADQVAVGSTADVFRRRTGIMLPNSVVRADAFRAVGGFDTSLRLAEDLDLVLRLAWHGPVAMVGSEALVSYRSHGENATLRHRALGAAIRGVLAGHLAEARSLGDRELVHALRESQSANDRYVAWRSARCARAMARDRRLVAATGELAWAVRFAPLAPASAVLRRCRPRRAGAAGSA
ncbi:glycosyltransferase family A protein [Isoptericola sp. NPDC055881]